MARPKKYTKHWLCKIAVKMLQYAETTELPLMEDFASKNNFWCQRVSEWGKEYVWFSEAINRFKQICVYKWLTAKDVAPAIKIFTLKNIAGWRDDFNFRGNVEHSGKIGIELFESIKEARSRLNTYESAN